MVNQAGNYKYIGLLLVVVVVVKTCDDVVVMANCGTVTKTRSINLKPSPIIV